MVDELEMAEAALLKWKLNACTPFQFDAWAEPLDGNGENKDSCLNGVDRNRCQS